jgi:hypothetical protein
MEGDSPVASCLERPGVSGRVTMIADSERLPALPLPLLRRLPGGTLSLLKSAHWCSPHIPKSRFHPPGSTYDVGLGASQTFPVPCNSHSPCDITKLRDFHAVVSRHSFAKLTCVSITFPDLIVAARTPTLMCQVGEFICLQQTASVCIPPVVNPVSVHILLVVNENVFNYTCPKDWDTKSHSVLVFLTSSISKPIKIQLRLGVRVSATYLDMLSDIATRHVVGPSVGTFVEPHSSMSTL